MHQNKYFPPTKSGSVWCCYHHIDNGGVKLELDEEYPQSLTISTSFFGYGETKLTLPFQDLYDLAKAITQLADIQKGLLERQE